MINPNDPAFPNKFNFKDGLTKREFFAGMAMQGMTAFHESVLRIETSTSLAVRAIGLADALIEKLNKNG